MLRPYTEVQKNSLTVSNSAGAYVGLRLEPRQHCAGLLTLEVSGRLTSIAPVASNIVSRNKYVIIRLVDYSISYYSASVQTEILNLPDTLAARYVVLTRRMLALGPNLGEPHTKAFGDGLFELRLKGADGIARVFYGTLVSRRIVILHSFIKKSQKTPRRELEIAERRLKEVKDGHA